MNRKFLLVAILMLAANTALASSTGMPWEDPLNQALDSLTGPVSRVFGAVAFIALGFGLAFSEGGGVMKKALWVLFGLSIAFNAVTWGLSFMGFSGGLTI